MTSSSIAWGELRPGGLDQRSGGMEHVEAVHLGLAGRARAAEGRVDRGASRVGRPAGAAITHRGVSSGPPRPALRCCPPRARCSWSTVTLGRRSPKSLPGQRFHRSAADPDCASLWREIATRRARNMRLFAADLRGTGELRDDLTDDQVADIIWSMNAAEYWDLLVRERGWRPEQFRDWLIDAWTRSLLRP